MRFRAGAGLHLGINMINMILVMLVVPGRPCCLRAPFARRSARLDAQPRPATAGIARRHSKRRRLMSPSGAA